MDTTAHEIVFTDTGCNFCDRAALEVFAASGMRKWLPELMAIIKRDGRGKKYDCLIGLSGGVDSSRVLHEAVSRGLRPLCFSVDNGWNDPRADENIMRLVEKLRVPFYRYVLDQDKFKELQAAFIRAGVPNIEIPTDHVLMATSYEMAEKNGIKWILSGGNVATESIMPPSWGYNARDLVHIKAIHKWAFGKKLTGLPTCSLLKFNWYKWVKGIEIFYLLDYLPYDRAESVALLSGGYGWKPYGEKHCESLFTSWFQNKYLFEKFGFDKRKAHLSSLIVSGQMTRDEALRELEACPVYPDIGLDWVVHKYPKRSHDAFAKDERLFTAIGRLVKFLRWS